MNSADVLSELLHPVPRERFLAEHWGRDSLFVPGTPGRFDAIAPLATLPTATIGALADGPVRQRLVRATYADAAGHAQSINAPPLQMAAALFDAGMTLVFSGAANDDTLARLARDLKGALDYPGTVNPELFLSPDGRGLPWHVDANHNFVLQLEGEKHWQVGPGVGVADVPFNVHLFQLDGASYRDALELAQLEVTPPAQDAVRDVVLRPGDVLYVPAGAWHRTAASRRSYSLSLALVPLTFARVLRGALTLLAFRAPEWRRDLHCEGWRDGDAGAMSPSLRAFLEARLDELRSELAMLAPEALPDLARLWSAGDFTALMRMAAQQVL